jgi:hypothetical protein
MAIPDVPAAQPAPSKADRAKVLLPPKGRYRLGALLRAPNRVLHPGQLIEKELDKTASSPKAVKEPNDQFKGTTAGIVRPRSPPPPPRPAARQDEVERVSAFVPGGFFTGKHSELTPSAHSCRFAGCSASSCAT